MAELNEERVREIARANAFLMIATLFLLLIVIVKTATELHRLEQRIQQLELRVK